MNKNDNNIKEEFSQLKNELNYAIKVFENRLSANNLEYQKNLSLIEKSSGKLANTLNEISKISGILCMIPDKLQSKIYDIIPEVASLIDKKQQESFAANYAAFGKKHDEYLEMFDKAHEKRSIKMKEMYDDLFRQTKTYTRRKILTIFFTFITSIVFSGVTSQGKFMNEEKTKNI